MGFVPKWSRGNHKKTAPSQSQQGVRQMPSLFHGAKDAQFSAPALFADGGEVSEEALKAQGMKASANENVGFFERLKMGNIDDPNSEAYRRFGAGRGRQERDMAMAEKQMDQLDSMRRDTAARDAEFDAADKQINQLDALKKTAPTAVASAPKFGEAFAAARKSGAAEFEWNGKKYNTKLKDNTPDAKSAMPAPKSSNLSDDPDRLAAAAKIAKGMAAAQKTEAASKANTSTDSMASVKSKMFRDAETGDSTAKNWLRGMLSSGQLSAEETARAKRLTGNK